MTLVLLLACAPNRASTTADAPFRLGAMKSAGWFVDARVPAGYGLGALVMTSIEADCDALRKVAEDPRDTEENLTWVADGLLVAFAWLSPGGEDPGWEGAYYSTPYYGGYYYGYGYDANEDAEPVRLLWAQAFTDRTLYDLMSQPGRGEITSVGDTIEGKLDLSLVRATFAAEDCGEIGEPPDTTPGWDTGWDTGWE